ncbi:MAG: hypothetical protein M1828_000068 [Chrysothrix sp. TS-e1954]|nr:MAG: hypothetical protein M1828_000068 [Chrysothrix sp. TS-e1954]
MHLLHLISALLLTTLNHLTHASPDLVVTTVIVTAAPSSTPTSPSYTSASHLKSSILNSTNTYRSLHNATHMTWNASLASYASTYLSSTCDFAHSGGPNGENLAAGYADVTAAVDGWGGEYKEYEGGFTEQTGHFSQLVWKASRTTGCAVRECDGEGGTPGWFLCCEYWPPGNVMGEFKSQVQGVVKGGGEGDGGYKGNLVGSGSSGRARVAGMLGVVATLAFI